jgi:cytochrome P450
MTLLLAGHETTATALSWAFELLFRHPAAYAGLRARLDDDAAVDAVATEVLRLRPPLTIVARRLARDAEVAGLDLPAGTMVAPCIWLAHRDPARYPEPLAFRPERWADGRRPETLSWLPFGGGTRRCVGAAFAQLELRTVLRTVVELAFPAPAEPGPDGSRRRAVVLAPARGARAVVV